MTSFNAGIEAAAQAADQMAANDALSHQKREAALQLAHAIRALKRPDPNEDEKAYLRDQTCILRKGKNGDTVICGQSVVEGHLRQGYQFDWKATDEARARDRAALAAMQPAPEPTEADVERLALWLFDQRQKTLSHPITWELTSEIGKEHFRQQARAALKAMEGE